MQIYQTCTWIHLGYLSARLDPTPHQTASLGQQAASPLYLQRRMGKILCFHAHYKLMIHSTEGNRRTTVMTHRGDALCNSIHWLTFCQWHAVNTSSAQHVVFLCVLSYAHTKPEHWWLFSSSIVNGTGFVWEREREAETECPEAGLGPHSVGKRNTWHNTERKKNHIYQWSLHNLSSQRHWQLWITIQLVALKKQSACRISGDITPQGRDTELLFLWAMLRSKVSSPFFSGKNIQEHTQMLHVYTVLYKFICFPF